MAVETDIPREEWSDTFDQLGLQYEGWRATIEIIRAPEDVSDDRDDEEDMEAREVVIESMAADLEEGADVITLSFTDDQPLTILDPVRVSLEQSEEGSDTRLEIETEMGLVRLWLRFPMESEEEEGEENESMW